MKKGFLKNFKKFTGKPRARVSFFNKVAGLSLQLPLKGDSDTGAFLRILQNF